MKKNIRVLHCCLMAVLVSASAPLLAQTDSVAYVEATTGNEQDSILATEYRKGILGYVDRRLGKMEEKKNGIIPVPLLYYTPDTRWAAGAFVVYYFKLKNKQGKETRLSYAKILGDYTQNNQLDFWASWNIFLRDEAYILKGEARYRNFPDQYYGIGNNTLLENGESYSYDLLDFTKMALRKVLPNTYLGADLRFTRYYNFTLHPEGMLADNITGNRGGNNTGVGIVFLHDSRDYVVNAKKGVFAEVSSYFYDTGFGSDFNYVNIKGNFSQYHEIWKNHIFAYQAVVNLNFGNPAFTNMARLGDDTILRGYAANRFRDNHMAAMQAEYRFPVWWRFGGTAFAGIGDVFGPNSETTWQNLKYGYGLGMRFALNKKERLNFRFDYAFGKENPTFYITVTEAF